MKAHRTIFDLFFVVCYVDYASKAEGGIKMRKKIKVISAFCLTILLALGEVEKYAE